MPSTVSKPPRRYTSATIRQRRERVLLAVRHLVVDKGFDGFTLVDVSRVATVSERTVYNIGKTKVDLVARAVQHYQQELASDQFAGDDYSLDQVLANLAEVSARLVPERNWAQTIARLYFSGATEQETYLSLVAISASHLAPAIRYCQRRGELAADAPVELVAHHFADTAFGILNGWALGRIADAHLPGHLEYALLAALVLLVIDDARPPLMARMSRLAGPLSEPRGWAGALRPGPE